MPLARERPQLGFQTVVVAAGDLLAPCDVGDEAFDEGHRAVAVVAPLVDRWRGTDGGQRLHERVDGCVTIEVLAAPRRRKVAPLDEVPGGVTEADSRPVLLPPAADLLAERAPDSRTGRGELRLEPAIEDPSEEPTRDVVGSDLELRIDPRLDRSLAQELRTEGVDGSDASRLELRQRLLQARSLRRRATWLVPPALDGVAQPQLQLAGGRVVKVTATMRSRRARPLASAASMRPTSAVVFPFPGSLHQERGRGVVAEAVAIGLIRQRYAHAGRQERP